MTNPPYKYGDFTIPSHWFANGYKQGTDPDVFLRSARIWRLRAPDGRFFHEGYADCRAWWGDEAGADLYLYTDAKFMASKASVAGVKPFASKSKATPDTAWRTPWLETPRWPSG